MNKIVWGAFTVTLGSAFPRKCHLKQMDYFSAFQMNQSGLALKKTWMDQATNGSTDRRWITLHGRVSFATLPPVGMNPMNKSQLPRWKLFDQHLGTFKVGKITFILPLFREHHRYLEKWNDPIFVHTLSYFKKWCKFISSPCYVGLCNLWTT